MVGPQAVTASSIYQILELIKTSFSAPHRKGEKGGGSSTETLHFNQT